MRNVLLRVVLNLLYSRDFKDVPFTTSGFGIILKHTSGDFIIATCLPFLDVASLERERVSQVTSGHPSQTFPRGGCGGQRREIPAPGADAPTALARCWTGGRTRRIRHAHAGGVGGRQGPRRLSDRSSFRPTATSRTRTSVLQPRGTECNHPLGGAWRQTDPRGLQMRPRLGSTYGL